MVLNIRRAGLTAALTIALATIALAAAGCSCGPGDEATLTLTAPDDGAMFTLADDTNADVAGFQLDADAMAVGLSVGARVELLLDEVAVTETTVPADGVLHFTDVTVTSGLHALVARTVEGALRSNEVNITVNDACFAVSIVTPVGGGDSVTFGPTDDTDGEACGSTFETGVVASTAAPDGSEARVYVNGTPRRTATVSGGVVRFDGVAFDNRGTTSNNLRVEVTDASGVTCTADFARPIYVDCTGVSCAISAPDTGTAFLNAADDVSSADGFQGDFDVTTDTEGSSQDVRLIIDGNESGALSATPSGIVATFGNVDLSEGVHRVQAECKDAAGNTTRSGVAEWTVDITPCGVTMDEPAADTLFVDSDDIDGATSGIQIAAIGTTATDCTGFRVGPCSGIGGVAFGTPETNWATSITLASTARQDLCAESEDEAGNVGTAMVTVRLNTTAPQVEIATPTDGAAFNIATDLTAGNVTCDVAFDVYCTGVGSDVTLIRNDTMNTLGTASCVADASVPSPYMGRAAFATVALPTVSSGPFPVIARQTVDRLTGDSAPISVSSDCVAPALTVTRPTCGGNLFPATQDESAAAGFQYRTVVQSPTDPSASVTLTIQPAGGGAPVYTATDTTTATIRNFPNADYTSGGMLEIIATSTDAAGNVGTSMPSPCTVNVQDLPSVSITSPTMGAVLGTTNDCGAGAGLQIPVMGTTDAVAGSTVTVTVGSTMTSGTVGAGGVINVCADAADGRSVAVRVEVTDTRGTGSATLTIVVDTMPPTIAISDLMASIFDRRGGVARFTWTAVNDAGGFTLSDYDLRCAATPITNETQWAAATSVTFSTSPGSAGTMQTEDVDAFRPGETRHCVLRGADPVGALTPLPSSSTTVTIGFLEHVVTGPATGGLGRDVAPVGDVNGDGIDDVLIGGTGRAYLFFGTGAGFVATTPSVTFLSTDANFGEQVAGFGDVNGDGRADFGISAYGTDGFKGRTVVFFGRPTSTPWPAACDLGGGCAPSLQLNSDDGAAGGPDDLAFFGYDISAAGDFDGDGLMDIAIGAPGANSFAGRVYILRGSSAFAAGTTIAFPGPSGSEPAGFLVAPPATTGQMGSAVSSLGGDVNGDARHDIVVGALGNGVPAAVLVVRGQAYSGSGLVLLPPAGVIGFDTGLENRFAGQVAGAGDLDGDGRLDVLVYDTASATAGLVNAYLRTATGYTTTSRFRITNDSPTPASDRFGESLGRGRHPFLGRLGDIDADGRTDVLIGSSQNGTGPGTAQLYYSDPPFVDRARSTAVATFPSTPNTSVASTNFVGDLNGDGFGDIVVGDPGASSGAGRFVIIY